ncbi:MAG: taurine catabolism dioxygenase TauD [Chromatiaceae bacterium]|nr:MAG: taurine catabolism dioxygenase TauD [Chromatiaceae bacterium]
MSRQVTPLSLDNTAAYAQWRAAKLDRLPADLAWFIVEIGDPRHLTPAEHGALLERLRCANLAVYVSHTGDDPDKAIPRRLGAQFGLHRLDHNPGADADAITSVRVQTDAGHAGYIPYTDRPIAWHTDGYYNAPGSQLGAFILHCVRPAASGGDNGLIDPELLYIRLRDRDPAHIRALMHAAAMTIPANVVAGKVVRPVSVGPVFSANRQGRLAMRYTDRRRNIQWRDDPATAAALAALRALLEAPETLPVAIRLEPGWGVICNNCLHRRGGFSDDPAYPRLLYRARYLDRIVGT